MKLRYYIIGFLALIVIYYVLGSMDCEPPSLARFAVPALAPVSDDDNVYFGLVAATNAGGSADPEDAAEEEKAAVEAVTAVLQSSRRSAWRAPDGEPSLDAMEAIVLVRLCEKHGLRQIERGEIGAATETVRGLLSLGRKMAQDAETAVVWWIGRDFAEKGDGLAVSIVESGKATPEELRALLGVLRETPAATWRKSLQRAMKADFCMMYRHVLKARDVVEETKDGDTPYDTPYRMYRNLFHDADALRFVLKSFAVHPNRTLKSYAKRLDKALELLDRNFDAAAWDAFEKDGSGWIESVAKCPAVPNFIGRQYMDGRRTLCAGCAKEAALAEFYHAVAEVAAAVALYRRANGGAMPKTLAELVPDYLPAVPKDPFAQDAEVGYDASNGTVSSADGVWEKAVCDVETP